MLCSHNLKIPTSYTKMPDNNFKYKHLSQQERKEALDRWKKYVVDNELQEYPQRKNYYKLQGSYYVQDSEAVWQMMENGKLGNEIIDRIEQTKGKMR